MPQSDGGSPIAGAAAIEPEFVRDRHGVAVARRGDAGPTQERIKQDPFSYGNVYHPGDGITKKSEARAYRAADLMGRMLAKGTIDLDEAMAGRAFRANFHRAGYVGIRASDPAKVPGGHGLDRVSDAAVDARVWVWGRLAALGGYNAPAARAAWFVLGCDLSIRAWARRERWGNSGHLSEASARRTIYGALAGLAEIERGERAEEK